MIELIIYEMHRYLFIFFFLSKKKKKRKKKFPTHPSQKNKKQKTTPPQKKQDNNRINQRWNTHLIPYLCILFYFFFLSFSNSFIICKFIVLFPCPV